jgi:putative ubiquitin-RnfH superfamily antitoxin RatB of RatAB toxin-antitoxin module
MTEPAAAGAAAIVVSVVYALPDRYWSVEVRVPATATVGEALRAAALAVDGMEIAPDRLAVFGRPVTAATTLHDGDRIEILRPLVTDPKDARRQRAGAARRK